MKHTNITWIVWFQNMAAMIDITNTLSIQHNDKKLGFQSQITIFTSF